MKGKDMTKKISLVLCLFLLCGCATAMVANLTKHREHYVPSGDSNFGLIYFYRESEFTGSLRTVYINVDGKRRGALNSGTYFVYETTPGEHVASVENWLGEDSSRTIHVETGKNYYIKGGVKMGLWDAVPFLNFVAREEGEGAIKDLNYATMKEKDLREK
ncbi:MAG: DUF2846 domain-containing protein [Candidatus Omnitrophica bacterium]|nr:DUF2846 domain-containing protein [Candidatus Omnitrophota bacterium]